LPRKNPARTHHLGHRRDRTEVNRGNTCSLDLFCKR
jgi:hypothetical protein